MTKVKVPECKTTTNTTSSTKMNGNHSLINNVYVLYILFHRFLPGKISMDPYHYLRLLHLSYSYMDCVHEQPQVKATGYTLAMRS